MRTGKGDGNRLGGRTCRVVGLLFVASQLCVEARAQLEQAEQALLPAVASNQSVSLQDDAGRALDTTNDPMIAQRTTESQAAEPATIPRPVPDDPRPIRRARAAPGPGPAPLAEPTVWYRSALGATLVVLGAIALLFLGIRRFLPAVAAADQRTLAVVARAALSPKHAVALIQLPQRFLLVGIGPESVSVLSEISDPAETADLAAAVLAGKGNSHRRFEEALTREHRGFEAEHNVRIRTPEIVSRTGRPAALGDLLRRVRGLQGRQGKNRAAV